jgi:hypothetical protein
LSLCTDYTTQILDTLHLLYSTTFCHSVHLILHYPLSLCTINTKQFCIAYRCPSVRFSTPFFLLQNNPSGPLILNLKQFRI